MIETGRLRLREWKPSDLCSIRSLLGDPDVMRFSDSGVLEKLDQRAWLDRAAASFCNSGLPGSLRIERKCDGTFVGFLSLSRDPARVGATDAEIGFRLVKAAWNKGFATEAARELIKAAGYRDKTERIVAIVDPNNRRSVRVLEKLGMKLQGGIMLDGYEYPDHLWALRVSGVPPC